MDPDHLAPLDVRVSQVCLVNQEMLVQRVPLDSAAHQAGRETMDPPVSLVHLVTLVPLVQMAHRVLPVLQDQFQQPTASSSPDIVRVRMCHSVLTVLA